MTEKERIELLAAVATATYSDEERLEAVKARIAELFKRKTADWKVMDLLHRYYVLQHYYTLLLDGEPKMDIYATLKDVWGHSDSSIRRWITDFESGNVLIPSAKGCHIKVGPGLDSVELIAMFKSYCNAEIAAKHQPTTTDITKWVNENLLADKVAARGRPYSADTTGEWMKGLGFKWGKFKKLVYFDGHEAEAQKKVLF